VIVAGVIATASGLVHATDAAGAPLPSAWCGTDEVATDRPDLVAERQIHVIYAYPSDSPDRFPAVARDIIRDLAGVDSWWRSQDPARTPRFDLATFPDCDTEFGALDLSSVQLSADNATLDPTAPDFTSRMGSELTRAGFTNTDKKYLVFYDGAGPADFCGVSNGSPSRGGPSVASYVFSRGMAACLVGGAGTGNGWPAHTAVHELLHGLIGGFAPGTAPNACDDQGHVCDSQRDILSTGSVHPSPFLSDMVLDVNHDDYYEHSGSWPDVRNSAWLSHVERPPGMVGVTVAGDPGRSMVVVGPQPLFCTSSCTQRYDGGSQVQMAVVEQSGYRLLRWEGACSGSASTCTVTAGGDDVNVLATFGPAAVVRVRAVGHGSVVQFGGDACVDDCTWDVIPGAQIALAAQPERGMRFVGWRGLCSGPARSCIVATTRDARQPSITAVFANLSRHGQRDRRGRKS
jgi:List-Bact-rpt repeat protein